MKEEIAEFKTWLAEIKEMMVRPISVSSLDDAEKYVLAAQRKLAQLNNLQSGEKENLVENLRSICYELIASFAVYILRSNDTTFISTPRNVDFVKKQLLELGLYQQYSTDYQHCLQLLRDYYFKKIVASFKLIKDKVPENKTWLSQITSKVIGKDKTKNFAELQNDFYEVTTGEQRTIIFNEIVEKYGKFFQPSIPALQQLINNYNDIAERHKKIIITKTKAVEVSIKSPNEKRKLSEHPSLITLSFTQARTEISTKRKMDERPVVKIPNEPVKRQATAQLVTSGPLCSTKVEPGIDERRKQLQQKGLNVDLPTANDKGAKILVLKVVGGSQPSQPIKKPQI